MDVATDFTDVFPRAWARGQCDVASLVNVAEADDDVVIALLK